MSAYTEPVAEWGGSSEPASAACPSCATRPDDDPCYRCRSARRLRERRAVVVSRDLPLEDPGDHAWRTYEDWPMSVR